MQGAGEEARGGHRRGDVGSLQPRSLGTLGMPESAGAAEAHRHDGLVWGMSSCGAGEGHEGSAGVVLVLSGFRKTERGLGILSVAQAATKRALKCPSPSPLLRDRREQGLGWQVSALTHQAPALFLSPIWCLIPAFFQSDADYTQCPGNVLLTGSTWG